MKSMKWTLPAVALLMASAWVVEPLAQNTNRKARTRRPSSAIGAGGAGTYARRTQRKAPTAAQTPNAPNRNGSFLGGTDEGTGIRRRGNQNAPHPTNPTNANVNANANANSSFIGGSDDGTGIRRRGNQNGTNAQPTDTVNANANANANSPYLGGQSDGTGIRRKAPRRRRRP